MKTRMSVECWLVNAAGEVLLLHVSAKECPPNGFWQPLTGGIKEGESPLDAVYREIYEETGIGVEDVEPQEVASGILVHISDELDVSKTLYYARVAATDVKIAPDEHDDYCWSSIADVPGFLHWESNRATWARVLPQIVQGC